MCVVSLRTDRHQYTWGSRPDTQHLNGTRYQLLPTEPTSTVPRRIKTDVATHASSSTTADNNTSLSYTAYLQPTTPQSGDYDGDEQRGPQRSDESS